MSNTADHVHAIDVDAPVRVAYNQWTQFEEFPTFMEGVNSVVQTSDDMLTWTVKIGGIERTFETRITEQTPDHRIAWNTESGPYHGGVVTFHSLAENQTKVTLQMDFDPDGFLENVGDKLGFVSARIRGDMENFKEFIEDRDRATGAWRGTIVHS